MTNSQNPFSMPVLVAIGAGVVIAGLAGVSAVTALQRPQPPDAEPSPLPTDGGLQVNPTPSVTPAAAPLPIAVATPIPSPLPTLTSAPTPAAIPAVAPAPEGAWVITRSVAGYNAWNFRDVPNGKITAYIPFETQLYSDRRVDGMWQSVLCPADICQQPRWGWINKSGIVEVRR